MEPLGCELPNEARTAIQSNTHNKQHETKHSNELPKHDFSPIIFVPGDSRIKEGVEMYFDRYQK